MWSRYLFDVCTRKIHLCAFLIYGRQTGWKTTNHGNQPWLQSNGRLRLESKPNTVICLSGSFVLYRDSSGKWCHASLEPKIYNITGHIEKGENNNPVASQSGPKKTSCFKIIWGELLLAHSLPYFIKRHPLQHFKSRQNVAFTINPMQTPTRKLN